MKELLNRINKGFENLTQGKSPDLMIKAPGRINLIGEHTDYNMGMVLPAAIDKYFVYGFRKNDSNLINVKALDIGETHTIDLNNLVKTDSTWVNFLTGLLIQLRNRGNLISGIDCVMASNIPIGAGMSSSSALECGFIGGINILYDLQLEPWEMIRMSHSSNHEFLGVKGGVLDQFSSFFGKKGYAMMMDCSTQTFDYKPIIFDKFNIVLINTNVKHDHVSGEYNVRPKECKEALEMLQASHAHLTALSEVTNTILQDSKLPTHLYNRVKFIIAENQRVADFADALDRKDFNTIGNLLYQSHDGLQNQYLVSCPELDILVDITRQMPSVIGSRMMGGGFGGCTINIVHKASAIEDVDLILSKYEKHTGIKPEAYFVNICDGVSEIRPSDLIS